MQISLGMILFNMIPLINCINLILTFIEMEEENDIVDNNMIQNNILNTTNIINVLTVILQLALEVFESEIEDKIHLLIQGLRDYRYNLIYLYTL